MAVKFCHVSPPAHFWAWLGGDVVGGGHSGRRFRLGQLGPDQVPVVGAQVLTGDRSSGFALYGRCQAGRTCAQPVVDVLEMAKRGSAGQGHLVPPGNVQFGEVCFKVHDLITPNGAAYVNTVRCNDRVLTMRMAKPMSDEARARVDRLVAWCVNKKIAVAEDGKSVLPRLFAAHALKAGLVGNESYWLGILGKADRAFAAKKARLVERALGIPEFYLDGVDAINTPSNKWPFSEDLGRAIAKLSPEDVWHAENALRAHLKIDPLPRAGLGEAYDEQAMPRFASG